MIRVNIGEIVLIALAALPAVGFGQERPPIIDMHMHASELGAAAAPGRCRSSIFWGNDVDPCEIPLPSGSADRDVLALTLDAMDQYNIVLGFLSSIPLENVYRWVEAAPGRFIASPVPFREPEGIDPAMLRREYEAGRLEGMGELGTQYLGIPPDDPRVEPYFALAEEFDVPVLIHLQGIGAPRPTFRISAGHPELLEEVLRRHPGLRVYLENAGFPFLAETISLMYTFPQVYADLSTFTWLIPRRLFYSYLRSLLDAGLDKRLMFGTDATNRPHLIGAAIEAIESAPFLSEEQKRDIFYNNAATFLRLSEEQIAAHHGR